jgi:polar amino acid transport system permease protein
VGPVGRRAEDGARQRRRITTPDEDLVVAPRRRWGQWVTTVVVALVVVWLVSAAAQSHFVDIGDVRHYLFNRLILRGVKNTIVLSVAAQVIGIVLGLLFAVGRMSRNVSTRGISTFYVWLFRGTPVIVQLIFWFNGVPAVFRNLTLAVPFTHITLFTTPMVEFMTPFTAALLGLGLNEGAYMAEIVRAGITSVDSGQTEAASALGMTSRTTLRRVVLPQAMRVIIPPTGNEFISMLKTSSLATVITFAELFHRGQDIYTSNLKIMPLLLVVSLWYLAMTTVASIGQYYLEKRFNRGQTIIYV